MNANKRFMRIGALATAFLLAIGFGSTEISAATESQTVALEGAKSAKVEIDMGLGELNLRAGAEAANLMDAEFQYDGDDWAPDVAYSVENEEGQLKVEQGDGGGTFGHWPWDEGDSRWDLRLNGAVPTDLIVHLGAGKSDLDLSEVNLDTLDVELGAGETTVDLTGTREHDVQATIEGGAGKLTLRLPRDVGVRIEADTAIGDIDEVGLHKEGDAYVNDAYGTFPFTIEVKLDLGVGNVKLEVVA